MGVPVVLAPLALQPDVGRVYATIPEGWTIEEIVAHLLPDVPETVIDRVTVTMINGKTSARVPRRVWHRVRPFAGTQIVIMIAPGKAVFSLLVSIAALAISTFFTAGLGTGLAAGLLRGAISFGVTALGGLLINALFPVKKEKQEKPTYAVTGWQNEYRPDDVVPRIFGTLRYAPPLATFSYIEVVGGILYNRMVVLWGYGPIELSDLKNGDTLLSKYENVEVETRLGYPDDELLTLYPQQMVEEKVGTDLVREFRRDAAGNPLPGGWFAPVDEKPIERTTARDCAYALIILSLPQGLGYTNSKGEKRGYTVKLAIRVRPADSDVWEARPDVTIRAKKFAGFFREIRIDFAERGAYTIEITRKSVSEYPDGDANQYVMLCTWAVLQSFRPEYPFNFSKPVALTAIRVKSTFQLNGALDALNGIVKSVEPDWDADDEEWTERATQNPASHALYTLRGPGLYRSVADEQIDFDGFAEWHAFCEEKGLKYNRAHDFEGGLGEKLAAIGAAGRAVVRKDGRRWIVVIDRPREIPADHITPRNSSGISVSQSYFEPPHAYRVPFLDETNEFQQAERIVPWPGHVGPVDITEQIEMPGKTNPDEIWIETRRRQYEVMNRSTVYTATQQGLARTSTSGDLVLASRDIVRRAMASARVKAVRGNLVEIDEVWTMEAGVDYAIRFRQFDEDDTIGTSIVRTIATVAGETSAIRLTGSGEKPTAGDLLIFGPAASDSFRLIVVEIERGKDDTAILTMLPEAAIIDELTDAEVPPVWSGRVGAEIAFLDNPPRAPRFVDILTGTEDTGRVGGIVVLLRPDPTDPVVVGTFRVRHRLHGTGTWSGPVSCSAADANVSVPGYSAGDSVDIQAWSISIHGIPGAYGDIVLVSVGDAPPASPELGAEYPVIF